MSARSHTSARRFRSVIAGWVSVWDDHFAWSSVPWSWGGAVVDVVSPLRRSIASVLALAMVLSLTMGMESARADDAAAAQSVTAGIANALVGLSEVDTDPLALEAVPLTPAGLDQVLSLGAVLPALAAELPAAPGDLDGLFAALDPDLGGISIDQGAFPGTDAPLTATLTGVPTDNDVLDLTISLQRTLSSPLVVLTDLVAYETDALPITGTFETDLQLSWDPATIETGLADVQLQLGELSLGATVGDPEADLFPAANPLSMTVGILAVDATGSAVGAVSLSRPADTQPTDLATWFTTPARDRFALRLDAASAAVDLDLTSTLAVTGGAPPLSGSISLDWEAFGPPGTNDLTGWLDAVQVQLGDLDDFRNLLIEEVIAGIAQLAVALRGTQLSGLLDVPLPFVREQLSDALHAGQAILEWLAAQETADGRALAVLDADGQVVELLEDLSRELLVELGLTDLQAVLDALTAELPASIPLELSYDPGLQQLRFDLGWTLEDGFDDLSVNIADAFETQVGVGDLGAQLGGETAFAFTPSVEAALGLVVDLSFDEVRRDLEALEFDIDAFVAEYSQERLDDLLSVVDRFQLDPTRTSVDVDLDMAGSLDLRGSIGFLGIGAKTTSPFQLTSAGDGSMLSLNVLGEDPISLADLLDDLPNRVDVDYDIGVPEFVLQVSGGLDGGLGLTGDITVAWPNILELSTLQVTPVLGSGFDDLLSFRFSGDPFQLLRLVLDGYDALVAALQTDLRRNSLLSDALPLAEVDIDDLVAELALVREQLGAIATDPAGNLQGVGDQLNTLLVDAFAGVGADVSDDTRLVRFDLDEHGDQVVVRVVFELGVCGVLEGQPQPPECVLNRALDIPFELDVISLLPGDDAAALIGSLVSLDSAGRLTAEYDATVKLDLGVALPQVDIDVGFSVEDREDQAQLEQRFVAASAPSFLVYPGTGVQASLDLRGEFELDLAIGPITAQAGRADDKATLELAPEFSFALGGPDPVEVNVSNPRAGLTSVVDGFAFSLTGNAVSCPVAVQPSDLDDGGEDNGEENGEEGEETEPSTDAPVRGDEGEVTAQACARLPLYLNNVWLGDLGFVAPNLLLPDGGTVGGESFGPWTAALPEDLADKVLAALLDWRLLLEGLRTVVGLTATALDGAAQGVRVPVIGEALDGGAQVAEQLEDALGALSETIAEYDNAGQLRNALQAEIDGAFGPLLDEDEDSPLTVTLLCGATECADGDSVATITDGQVALKLGDTVEADLPGFDLGFPGLSLTIYDDVVEEDGSVTPGAGALRPRVGWGLDLVVGLDASGFYLVTQDEGAAAGDYKKQIEVFTDVALPERLSGDLALFRVDLDRLSDSAYEERTGRSRQTREIDGDDRSLDLALSAGAEVRAGTGGRVPFHQLVSGTARDTFVLAVDTNVDLGYTVATTVTLPGIDVGDEVIPSVIGDLLLAWGYSADTSSGFTFDSADLRPDVLGFRDVRVDLGEFFSGFLGPIFSEVQRFTRPFQPVIDTVNAPIPGLSDLSQAIGGPELTLITLFEAASGADLTFLKRILALVELINQIPADEAGNMVVPLGDFDLDFDGLLDAPRPASQRGSLVNPLAGVETRDLLSGGASPFGDPGSTTAISRSREGGGFTFPAFADPTSFFGLLVGQDVTLIRWDSGTLRAGFSVSYTFPPIFVGPVPIGFALSAGASIEGRFAVGYDTYGIRRAVDRFTSIDNPTAENVLGGIGMLFNGLFLDDLDENGKDVPEIKLIAEFAAGAGLSLGVISAGLKLGLRATIDFDLRDESGTGKIRADAVFNLLRTPICLFEVGGQLEVFLNAYLKILFSSFDFTIFKFTVLRVNDIFAAACGPQPPNLADPVSVDGGTVLVLNAGARGGQRGVGVGETEEEFTVRPLNDENTSFSVAAFGEYEEYHDITGAPLGDGRNIKVVGDGGTDDDTFQFLDGVRNTDDIDDLLDEETQQTGGFENETIEATADVLFCGGGGSDVLIGGRGNDLLIGDGSCSASGTGFSISTGENPLPNEDADPGQYDGDDRISAAGGNNLMLGLGGNDQLYGGPGVDVLVGGSGNDSLDAGGSGGDVLIGGSLVAPPAGALNPGEQVLGSRVAVSLASAATAPGNDQLFGGDGADVLIGDNGAVTTNGSQVTGPSLQRVFVDERYGGNDFLDGGRGNDRLFGGPGTNELYGGRGDDVLVGGPGRDLLVGGTADDDGQPGRNVLVGGGGNDLMVAHDADVSRDEGDGSFQAAVPIDASISQPAVLIGGGLTDLPTPGNDVAWGGGGDDLMFGDNTEPVSGSLRPVPDAGGASGLIAYPASLTGGAFDTLAARDGDGYPTGLRPIGSAGGNDRLYGLAGDDTVLGGPGDDVLVGGVPGRTTADGTAVGNIDPGSDLLIGNEGDDLIVGGHTELFDVAGEVSARPLGGAGLASNRLIGGSWSTTPIGGSDPGDDELVADRRGDVLVGDDGHISRDGVTAQDRDVTVLLEVGGEDVLRGGAGDDRMFGGPGDDELFGAGGDDHLEGGPGDDLLDGGPGDDVLIGGNSREGAPSGDNLLIGGGGDDALAGDNARIERTEPGEGIHGSRYLVELFDLPVAGAPASDQPDAQTAGADVLVGGALTGRTVGDDLLFGQGGSDLLVGDDARNVPASDTRLAPYGPELLDNVRWGRFLPLESGQGGHDLLVGGPDDDQLYGGPGRDALIGGSSVHTPFDSTTVPTDDLVHAVPQPLAADTSLEDVDDPTPLAGLESGDDLLVGGPGGDLLAGDNARAERVTPGTGVDGSPFLLERYDRAVAGASDQPDPGTAGEDVLVGGSLATDAVSSDLLFGQGGDDLLIGDDADVSTAAAVAERFGDLVVSDTWGAFVPRDGEGVPGGDDRLEGGAGDDVLFGGPGDDLLLGGSDRDWDLGASVPIEVELDGHVSIGGDRSDVLVGGTGVDHLFGDNARVELTSPGGGDAIAAALASRAVDAGLYDVAIGGQPAPDPLTGGDDVLIGGAIGADSAVLGDAGDDVGFGQGGDDLLIGDHARLLAGDDRRFAPVLGRGGDDFLEGNAGDDTLFGGDGDDVLIGGSSDRAVPDAATAGLAAGDDLLVGGPDDDVLLGDNGRLCPEARDPDGDCPLGPEVRWWDLTGPTGTLTTWWNPANGGQLGGDYVQPFDEPLLGADAADLPLAATAGDDLVIGGSLRAGLSTDGATPVADGVGLLSGQTDDDHPGNDLQHGQAGDDALFGDDVLVRLDLLDGWDGPSGAGAWQALRRGLADTIDGHRSGWPLASLEQTDGEVAAGGDDLMLGGPDDDVMFGGPGQDDMIGGSWNAGRLDGRDQLDAGPGHDVALGDNARIVRPLLGTELVCQTYRHRDADVGAWSAVAGPGDGIAACGLGTPDADPDNGVFTRVEREVEMLDTDPNLDGDGVSQTAGSDLIWGGDGDDTLIGQFDDTAAFVPASSGDPFAPSGDGAWDGWSSVRVVEWCRQDDAFAALLAGYPNAFDGITDAQYDALTADAVSDPAGALAAYVGLLASGSGHLDVDPMDLVAYDLDDIRIAGDVLCGGDGEDAILGDQGVVVDIVEDGSREEFIRPRQPFVSTTIFETGTLTRETTLTQFTVGGDDLILGGPGGDSIHGGAGDDLINGNAGIDVIFGGDGDDVMWGGRGEDHLYGGYGDDHLDVRPRPATASGWPGDPAAWFLFGIEADIYQGLDQIYGGWDADVMQADEGGNGPVDGDRLMDWGGVYNLSYVCAPTYGAWITIRSPAPGLIDYLLDKAEGHGAVDVRTEGSSGFNEVAMVYTRDIRNNVNPPQGETPGHFTCGSADPTRGPGVKDPLP
jgi:Ca2+-binding RTX toxin-like protein